MINRTLQFCGYAYGNTPVQVIAQINGQTVFSGEVATIDAPMPTPGADVVAAPPLFSAVDCDLFPPRFFGSYPMTISVTTGSGIMIQNINSNYMTVSTDPETQGNATGFVNIGNYVGDPRTNVKIDGVLQEKSDPPAGADNSGVWTWTVPQGSTISYDLNVSVGNVAV